MKDTRNWLHWLSLLAILVLTAYLRLHHVAETPGWYSDEGTHLNIAQQLLAGRTQYLAINQSTLLVAKLPLFDYLLAGAMRVGGTDIHTLRVLTGSLGVLAVALLYVVTSVTLNRRLALLAALLLAIYPQAVLYSRFGFSYNLLAPLMLLVYLGLVKYRESSSRRWLALAVLAVGVGLTSDLMMGAFILPVLLIIGFHRRRDSLWAVPLMIAPVGLYATFMLATAPDAFLFDLGYTMTRLGGKPLTEQINNLALNYTVLLSQDFWPLVGLIGLFLLPARSRLVALLLLFVPITLLGRTVALYSLSAYYLIPLLPLMALGAARFVQCAIAFITAEFAVRGRRRGKVVAQGIALLLIAMPLLTISLDIFNKVNSHYTTAIDPFLLDPVSSRRVADFVNSAIKPGDTIIASPVMAWLFHADTADFQMAVAFAGQETPHLPGNIPAARFAFNPHYQQAHFVVVDNLWRNWGAVHIPAVVTMLAEIETWPLVFEASLIQVYENPN